MGFELINLNGGLVQRQAVEEVMKCNQFTERFGVILTNKQAIELVEIRKIALSSNMRIEFGGGVIDKIIKEFCDSPYIISNENYFVTISDLVELFYYYKNETLDIVSDDSLIKFMKASFDGVCQGSLELLNTRELYRFAKNLRYGVRENDIEDRLEGEWEYE